MSLYGKKPQSKVWVKEPPLSLFIRKERRQNIGPHALNFPEIADFDRPSDDLSLS